MKLNFLFGPQLKYLHNGSIKWASHKTELLSFLPKPEIANSIVPISWGFIVDQKNQKWNQTETKHTIQIKPQNKFKETYEIINQVQNGG